MPRRSTRTGRAVARSIQTRTFAFAWLSSPTTVGQGTVKPSAFTPRISFNPGIGSALPRNSPRPPKRPKENSRAADFGMIRNCFDVVLEAESVLAGPVDETRIWGTILDVVDALRAGRDPGNMGDEFGLLGVVVARRDQDHVAPEPSGPGHGPGDLGEHVRRSVQLPCDGRGNE